MQTDTGEYEPIYTWNGEWNIIAIERGYRFEFRSESPYFPPIIIGIGKSRIAAEIDARKEREKYHVQQEQ